MKGSFVRNLQIMTTDRQIFPTPIQPSRYVPAGSGGASYRVGIIRSLLYKFIMSLLSRLALMAKAIYQQAVGIIIHRPLMTSDFTV